LVIEVDAVVKDTDTAALHELPPRPHDVVARAEPQGRARERAQLLVAGEEVLELCARVEIAVEVRLGLRVAAQPRLEDPALFERMRIAELELIGLDLPRIRVPAVFAVQRGTVRQV